MFRQMADEVFVCARGVIANRLLAESDGCAGARVR